MDPHLLEGILSPDVLQYLYQLPAIQPSQLPIPPSGQPGPSHADTLIRYVQHVQQATNTTSISDIIAKLKQEDATVIDQALQDLVNLVTSDDTSTRVTVAREIIQQAVAARLVQLARHCLERRTRINALVMLGLLVPYGNYGVQLTSMPLFPELLDWGLSHSDIGVRRITAALLSVTCSSATEHQNVYTLLRYAGGILVARIVDMIDLSQTSDAWGIDKLAFVLDCMITVAVYHNRALQEIGGVSLDRLCMACEAVLRMALAKVPASVSESAGGLVAVEDEAAQTSRMAARTLLTMSADRIYCAIQYAAYSLTLLHRAQCKRTPPLDVKLRLYQLQQDARLPDPVRQAVQQAVQVLLGGA